MAEETSQSSHGECSVHDLQRSSKKSMASVALVLIFQEESLFA